MPVLRLRPPRTTLLAVFFLALCLTPLAAAGIWLLVTYVIPLAIALWVLRAGTDIDADGVTVRVIAGHRHIAWDGIRGLSPGKRGELSVVLADGRLVRMPATRLRHLPLIAEVSGGRVTYPSEHERTAGRRTATPGQPDQSQGD